MSGGRSVNWDEGQGVVYSCRGYGILRFWSGKFDIKISFMKENGVFLEKQASNSYIKDINYC
jgi:hypothetical protein